MNTLSGVAQRLRVVSLFLLCSALILAIFPQPTPTLAASTNVVISQVYGGGGNAGAPYTHDFVELFNLGSTSVDLTGWSVQYASAAGSSWSNKLDLTGTIPAGGYRLLQLAVGAGNGVALPTPDQTGTLALSGTNGKVALVSSTTALACGSACAGTAGVVDFVGFGPTANNYEGSAPTAVLSNTTAALRAGNGCQDTDQNGADFSVAAPAPRNSASPANPCSGVTPTSTVVTATPTNTTVTITPTSTSTPTLTPTLSPTVTPPTGGSVVISQVYGGGGNAGAPYTNDFIELFNLGSTAVNLSGWSVQYASAAGSSWSNKLDLTGSIAPGGYYLIQLASGGANGVALPTADQTGGINMSGTNGKVALVSSTTVLACGSACAGTAGVVDFVGFGPTASNYEGSAPTGVLSATTAALRNGNGCQDTDQNGADFSVAAPTPRNSASPANLCGPITPLINEFSASTAGTDVEYIELYGAPSTDYSALTVVAIEGDLGANAPGTIDNAIALGTTDAAGLYLANLAANTLENGSITFLLVEGFSGSTGTDLDPTDSGTLASTPWTSIIDSVAVNDGGAGDLNYATPVLGVAYDGLSFAPGGASRIPNGSDTDSVSDWVRNDFDLYGIGTTAGTPIEGEAVNTPGEPNEAYEETTPPVGNCTPAPAITKIHTIQGSTDTATCVGSVLVEGVIVADFEGAAPALRGFYIQEEDADQDADPATSEGIFVFNANNNNVNLGDVVQVAGTVNEYQGQTQINATGITPISTGASVTPAVVSFPVASPTFLERYEGMLITIPETMYVTEHFQLGRFGQIVLSSDGRLYQPTSLAAPGAPAQAILAANNLRKLILDDNEQSENPTQIVFGRGGNPLSASNTLRGGDTINNIQGVLTYTWSGFSESGNAYRLRTLDTLGGVPNFVAANPRPTSPPNVGGELKVASFNVLNYFRTLDYATGNPNDNNCGPLNDTECRGADSASELSRQHTKLIAALLELDADVLGLMELENSTGVEPLVALVDGLNAATAPGTYAYVNTGVIGTDVIKVGIIYQTASVTPVGGPLVDLNNIHDRPPVAQTFEDADGETFTVVVNHFKSKGSCPSGASDPNRDIGDGQGCWAPRRVEQAQTLLAYLNANVSDPDVLIIGDLNSQTKEDPIVALESAGYTNLVEQFIGPEAYGYVFDGQWGYLDHALASASMLAQVTGTADFHINSDEPSVLDYNEDFKTAAQISGLYAPDEFRTSDHDPVLIGLSLGDGPTEPTATATATITSTSEPTATNTATATATSTPTVTNTATNTTAPTYTPTNTATNTTVPSTPLCQVQYSISSQWYNGFVANVTVTNLGPSLSNWNLGWNFSGNQQITNTWNATTLQNGQQVLASNVAWNASFPTNTTRSFGFQASYTGSNALPTSFKLNGLDCNGGVVPTATSTPTRTPTPVAWTGPCKVTYAISSQWYNGFVTNVTVTNQGIPLTGWNLAWSFAGNQQITNTWNATTIQNGQQVSATNAAWNASIPTNGSQSFGFQASYSGSNAVPSSFSLNGVSCSISS